MTMRLISILIILGSFIGGFLYAGGNLLSLWHPSELIIIIGLSIGVFLASVTKDTVKRTLSYILKYFKGRSLPDGIHQELKDLFVELSKEIKKNGIIILDRHLENAESSQIFSKYPLIVNEDELFLFIRSNLQYILLNPSPGMDFEAFLKNQIKLVIQKKMEVPKVTGKVANLVPGFGIIAAVMGVILTMRLLGEDIDIALLGESVGAALVGTLMGIFVAFAILAPFSHAIEGFIREEKNLYEVAAVYIEGVFKGDSSILFVEKGAMYSLEENHDAG